MYSTVLLRCDPQNQSFIISVRGHSCKHVGNSPGNQTKKLFSHTVLPQTTSLHSNHVWFVLPCPSLSSQSLPHSISQVLPWMVFLKWRSLRWHIIQWHLGKDWWSCDPVTSPKTHTKLFQWGTVANILNLNLDSSLSLPMAISTVVTGVQYAFFRITINDLLALYLQVDPICFGD